MCTVAIFMQIQKNRDAGTRDMQAQTHALHSPAPHRCAVMEIVISGPQSLSLALSTNSTMVLTIPTQPFLHGSKVVFPTGYSVLCELMVVDKGQTDKRQMCKSCPKTPEFHAATHLPCPTLHNFPSAFRVCKLQPRGGGGGISANDPTHVFVLHVFQEAQLSVGSFGKEFGLKRAVQFLNGHFGTTSSIDG